MSQAIVKEAKNVTLTFYFYFFLTNAKYTFLQSKYSEKICLLQVFIGFILKIETFDNSVLCSIRIFTQLKCYYMLIFLICPRIGLCIVNKTRYWLFFKASWLGSSSQPHRNSTFVAFLLRTRVICIKLATPFLMLKGTVSRDF
jgi:hypothetical protein